MRERLRGRGLGDVGMCCHKPSITLNVTGCADLQTLCSKLLGHQTAEDRQTHATKQ